MRQVRIRPQDSDTIMHVFNLWGNRFKNTILQSGISVWHCWQYIELNLEDGLAIGSDIFVKTVVAKARGEIAVSKRRLTRALGADGEAPATAPPPLYCFRQLRRLV